MTKKVAIVGGGTAGLFLAAFLNTDIYDVTIYEKKAALGRKFLVAGDGGFNLTHSEELSSFKSKYTPTSFMDNALDNFSNVALRTWLESLGIPTYVGSSGRVFPEKGIKPIEVLKRIETHLKQRKVRFEFHKTFTGWDKENSLEFNSKEVITADFIVFALGGSSWKVTGSDGSWFNIFSKKGIDTVPFYPANCAYRINWNELFIKKHEGKPLKNITISIDNKLQTGEATITKFGIEGNAIYGLSPEIQSSLITNGAATVFVDFKPAISLQAVTDKLTISKSNLTTSLKKEINLGQVVIDLIKATLTKEEFLDIATLAKFIKNFPLTIIAAAPLDEAISTSGGVALSAVDGNFEVKNLKNQFCIGEMLNWNAPTGGYLIQGCASMGAYVADYLNKLTEIN